MAVVGAVTAVASLGYGVYAGQRAQAAQQRAIEQANQQANQQRLDQQSQLKSQQDQMAATTASNLATEAQTKKDTMAAQADALAAEKASIGTNSQTLSDSLANQNKAAFAKQEPLIEQRLNSLGLLNSGALPEGQAKYQADLQAQADATLANYQVGAQTQLTQNSNAATADQVAADRANALLNIQNSEQNMSQNFATQNIDNTNNTAYQQYITSLQAAQSQSQQQGANAYTGLAGQIGGGLLNYYGSQNNTLSNNYAMQALINQRGTDYGATQGATNSYSGFYA